MKDVYCEAAKQDLMLSEHLLYDGRNLNYCYVTCNYVGIEGTKAYLLIRKLGLAMAGHRVPYPSG